MWAYECEKVGVWGWNGGIFSILFCPLCVMWNIYCCALSVVMLKANPIFESIFWCNLHFNKAVAQNRTSFGHVTFNNIQYLYISLRMWNTFIYQMTWHSPSSFFYAALFLHVTHYIITTRSTRPTFFFSRSPNSRWARFMIVLSMEMMLTLNI